ncbi:hypothetical protein HMPREF9123_0522 [Neisseria bacilliformis ATCC BAA-1200]|uniref:Uncharacterized protein n=1 Tax=Neisseria bacilliformis ATCC BAA-1200 TaxID=888742 RepID=F2B9Z3_9NEIS|nr:hypothetical protein HMPREF9123_0522 [Neisseria bacilliformis ATCC BAA-1200]
MAGSPKTGIGVINRFAAFGKYAGRLKSLAAAAAGGKKRKAV